MAVKLLQVLVLGVIAAAADYDVPVTWFPVGSSTSVPCQVPDADRIPTRRPPPPLDAENKARPKPYVWRHGDEELKRVSSNGTLEVSKRRDEEGIYQCYVKFQGKKVLGNPINVKFGYLANKFSVHPQKATVQLGQPHVLSCNISSEPPALIQWYKDGEPLPDDNSHIYLENQLLIAQAEFSDAGSYRCEASSPRISTKKVNSHVGKLVVEDSSDDAELSFLPVTFASYLEAPRYSRVVLPCPLVGGPKPKLIWELLPPVGLKQELEFEGENLNLDNIEVDQVGVYSCRIQGTKLIKYFNVTITESVSIPYPPESKQSVRASTIRFNCTATGRPDPQITWYKDGKKIPLTRRINVVLSVDDKRVPQLLIRGVTSEDAGVYQCFAHNSVSVKSAWATLDVIGAEAAAPTNLTCWPTGAYEVFLKWTKVPDIIAYTVQMIRPGGNSFPEQPVLNTNTSLKVKLPLTPYGFQVRAFVNSPTRNQASDMSETVICQGQGVPIKLTKVGEDEIHVSWEQFKEENPDVLEWILQYRVDNRTAEQNETLPAGVSIYTLIVSSPEPVQVRVLGTTQKPWPQQNLEHVPWSSSAAASHKLAFGEELMTPVKVEVTNVNPRNFTVRWQCKPKNKYSYRVCVVRKVGGSDECLESYLMSATINQLQPDTEYEVRVQAKLLGTDVWGEFSAPILTSTPPEGELEFEYTTDGVIVRWRGAGSRFVRYAQNLTQPIDTWRIINTTAGQNHVQITDLNPLLSTFVMVVGPGPWDQPRQVLTIWPRPPENSSSINLYIVIGCLVLLLCPLAAAAVCIWWKRKSRAGTRTRSPTAGTEEEVAELRNIGDRLANGGGSKDAGEPLLNGHVHITENPSQSKTPNGKVRKGQRYEATPFDFTRSDDADIMLETVLDETANTTLSLFDTSRRPEFEHRPRDISPNSSFNKLPDDNMNSELTRSNIQLDNSKILPTLQPNG